MAKRKRKFGWKKTALAGLILVLLAAFVYFLKPILIWKTYEDPRGFKISYPQGWLTERPEMKKYGDDELENLYVVSTPDNPSTPRTWLSLSRYKKPKGFVSLEEELSSSRFVIRQEKTTIGGLNALCNYSDSDDVRGRSCVIEGSGYIYGLYVSMDKSLHRKLSIDGLVIDGVISSIRINN